MKLSFRTFFSSVALLGLATATHAQLYIATGRNTGVTTRFNFDFNSVLNQVTVQLDNTFAGVGGVTGTLTSFGFNIPANLVNTGSLLSATGVPDGTWKFFNSYDINVGGNDFAQDVGAGSGKNENGGQPKHGVKFGSSATFKFQFADYDTMAGFIGFNGVTARWQSITTKGKEDSDVGFGVLNPTGSPSLTPVPEPATYGMFGVAALLVGVMFRRKRRQHTVLHPALA